MAGNLKTDVLRWQALWQMLREAALPPTVDQLAQRLGVDGSTVCADLVQLQRPPYSDGRVLERVRLETGDSARIMAVMGAGGTA